MERVEWDPKQPNSDAQSQHVSIHGGQGIGHQLG